MDFSYLDDLRNACVHVLVKLIIFGHTVPGQVYTQATNLLSLVVGTPRL